MSVFGDYARYYDAIYADKDYEAECDVVDNAIAIELGPGPKRILDAGCGTGTHALALARRGHIVTGIDRSAAMLEIAGGKAGDDVRFMPGDVLTLDLGEKFDVITCLFAVLSYQLSTVDVRSALRSFRRHLVAGGILVCDYWHAPAVFAVGPATKVKLGRAGTRRVVRTATPLGVDAFRQTNKTCYTFAVYDGSTFVEGFAEEHTVRFFYPDEMVHLLDAAGFAVAACFGEWDVGCALTDRTWTAVTIARAV
jgi:SAM-dependent methyltransferase